MIERSDLDLTGKTIMKAIHEAIDDSWDRHDEIYIEFVDGSSIRFKSMDADGYQSWITEISEDERHNRN